MPVYTDSRYSGGRQIWIRTERGAEEKTLPFIYAYKDVTVNMTTALVHTTQFGDRIDELARKYGGKSTLWWVIADFNGMFRLPLYLPPGLKLNIPTRDDFRRVGGT